MTCYNERMGNPAAKTFVDRTVSDITPNQRDVIQDLIGGNLAPDQRVFILAYRPDIEPTEDEKSAGRRRIQELLVKSHENAQQHGADADEIDAAIAEAIRSVDD